MRLKFIILILIFNRFQASKEECTKNHIRPARTTTEEMEGTKLQASAKSHYGT